MKSATFLLVVAAAVVVIAAIVVALAVAPDTQIAPPAGIERAAAPPDKGARTPRKSTPTQTVDSTVPQTPVDAAAAPTSSPAPSADAVPRAVLRFRLDGLDPAVPAADSNIVIAREKDAGAGDDGPSLSTDGGRGATFDVDVAALLPDGARTATLAVSLDRDGYLPFFGRTSIAVPRRGATTGDVAQSLDVRLQTAGWAKGVVQDERFAHVADACVGAFVHEGGGWRRVDDARTDGQGEFRVRLAPGQANLVVADADGLAPASIQATGVLRAESGLAPFTLQPGLAVAGTVRHADGRGVPGARVSAAPIWAKTSLQLGPHRLAYAAGQAIECPAGASATTDGLFRVSGLAPGDYDLGVTAPGVATEVLAALRRRASPPLDSVAFVVDGARLVVVATCDGRPVPRLHVAFFNDSAPKESNASGVSTDAKGAARLLAQPGAPYRVEIDARAFDAERRAVSAPAVGEEARVEIQLRRRLARPTLRLVLRPEDAEGADAVTAADVRVFVDDDPPPKDPESSETLMFSAGASVATGLWSGAYRVVVTPRGNSFRLPTVVRATLKDGEETKSELKFAHGGRVHLVTHTSAGAPIGAQYRAFGDAGDEVASGATNSDDPLLPPGRRRLEITPPGAPSRPIEALVRADETTVLDLEVAPPTK